MMRAVKMCIWFTWSRLPRALHLLALGLGLGDAKFATPIPHLSVALGEVLVSGREVERAQSYNGRESE
jgi:hypothetical protein